MSSHHEESLRCLRRKRLHAPQVGARQSPFSRKGHIAKQHGLRKTSVVSSCGFVVCVGFEVGLLWCVVELLLCCCVVGLCLLVVCCCCAGSGGGGGGCGGGGGGGGVGVVV